MNGKRFFYQETVGFVVLDRFLNESLMRVIAGKFRKNGAEISRPARISALRALEETGKWAP